MNVKKSLIREVLIIFGIIFVGVIFYHASLKSLDGINIKMEGHEWIQRNLSVATDQVPRYFIPENKYRLLILWFLVYPCFVCIRFILWAIKILKTR